MNTPDCLLLCGCYARVPWRRAATGNGVRCVHHGQTQIVKVNTHEWRVRCLDCRYGRWCGQDEKAARAKQRTHKQAYQYHAVSVAYDRVTEDGGGTLLRYREGRVKRTPPDRDTIRDDGPPLF